MFEDVYLEYYFTTRREIYFRMINYEFFSILAKEMGKG